MNGGSGTDPGSGSAGEPVSVSLDSVDSSVGLSQLSPGSTYEVSIVSTLGTEESDPVNHLVKTRECDGCFSIKLILKHSVANNGAAGPRLCHCISL